MKNKSKFILVSLILLCLVVSAGAAYADDLDTIQEGEVSGGVDVAYSNPGDVNGELSYDIPEDVQNVQYAGLFVDCYTAGSSNNAYGSEANVSVTSNGETEQIANERLVSTQGSQDGTVYTINDHTTKCYADYYMTYNLTDKLQGASGKVTINVSTGAIEGYEYYNKIKLIGLVFAYNDGDSDKISYWVNSGSSWIKGDSTDTAKATFNVGNLEDNVLKATIDNFALSSTDGIYSLNGEDLEESIAFDEGVYYFKYHQWDVLNKVTNGTNTLTYTPGEGAFSFRNVLSVLKLKRGDLPSAQAKLSSEYSGAVFAGTNNVLQLNLTNNGTSDTTYIVDFFVDGVKVDSVEVQLAVGEKNISYLIDDAIRPVTEDTVNGVSTTKVNYTAVISDKDTGFVIDELTLTPTLWYNGNLGKDLAYPAENITSFNNITVNGGIIIDTQAAGTYSASASTERTDVWTIDVPDDAVFVNGFVYVSYNWDKTNGNIPVWTTTFNGVAVSPVASYRDQSNMGSYGKYGYGLVVYDVSGLLVKGENTFVLTKDEFNKTAVYPSTLVALYNVTESDTVKTIYMSNGADLLSNANNFLGRTVASNDDLAINSIENVVDSKLYVFAAGAQSGEGNLIVNGESFENIWAGTSNSVEKYVVDLGTAPKASNAVSFVATGSTILALEQFIVVEFTTPSVEAKLSSEYSGAVFAGTNNVLQVNLTNNGQAGSTYIVELYADGVKVNATEVQLDAGAKTSVYLTDDTIRPVTEDTVNGVSTTKVNYTAVISSSGLVLDELTLTPTLWYNGNLGKDLAYPAENITSFNNITVNGGIIIDTQAAGTYSASASTERTDVWTIDVPDDAVFVNGFVYVSYNWDKTNGNIPVWTTTFNGVAVSPVASYRDQSNMGTYGKYGYGLVVYDVSGLLVKGENTFVLTKDEFNKTAVYPSTLVALYNVTESDTVKTIYMFNGADLLSNANNFLGRIVASNSVLDINADGNILGSNLTVFAAGAQSGEGNLIVNGESFVNVWAGTSNSVEQYVVDLGTAPKASNAVSFVATGSTILALQQFVIVEYEISSAKASLGSEYSGAAFAGTDNVLELNLTNNGFIKNTYTVDFYVDGEKVNSSVIELDIGEKTVLYLVDEKIRPVTEDTVNGVSTTKINYTVVISDANGDVLDELTLTPTLWYNGNLGKDLAYPADSISSFNNITVNGGIIIDTKDDSTYLGAKTLGRTDVWTISVPDDAVFVNGFVYVSYNWDKTNGNIPVWTTTFNGVAVSPVASYRDQSNMGTYGKYGYGLVVYDVSGLLVKGENTFTLEKENGTTAVYPSTLLALYNVTKSDTTKTIYMYNGADLLSNANNFLGRTVASDSVLGADVKGGIVDAKLYVFAASAQAGEGNLIVNGKSYEDIWSGSSNSVGEYVVDLGTAPKASNAVSFIATGSTILALQQFVVVEKAIPQATTIACKAMTTTTVNTKVNGKNAGKNFSITLKDKNGKVLAGKQVIFTLNGKTYKRTTNKKGVASLKIALSKKGTYKITISFRGDNWYKASSVSTKIKVNPQKVKLTVPAKKYKAKAKTKTLTATLKAANKKAIQGKKLVFIVNKKKYTAKTNKKGIAKVKVKLSKKKTYKFTVKFAGDKTFKAITKKGKVTIK